MPKEGNQVIPVDSTGAVVPAEVQKKPMQTGRAELPVDDGQEEPSNALFPKTPIANVVSELVKKKKNKK